jgi:hypothetical protein
MLGGEATRIFMLYVPRKLGSHTVGCVATHISARTVREWIQEKIVGEVGRHECSLDNILGDAAPAG